MAVYREEKTNTWRAVYRYSDWNGERNQTQKLCGLLHGGFENPAQGNMWATKDHIIRTKPLPYFGRRKMCNIMTQQIITWQDEMLNHKDENGKPPTRRCT